MYIDILSGLQKILYFDTFMTARELFGDEAAIHWWNSRRDEVLAQHTQKQKPSKGDLRSSSAHLHINEQEEPNEFRKAYDLAKHKDATLFHEDFVRFKILGREMEKGFEPSPHIQKEYRALGALLAQNKQWLKDLKQYDAQQAHLIEKMGRDHTHEQAQAKMVSLDRERGGFSL
jgi:hypothetical protein